MTYRLASRLAVLVALFGASAAGGAWARREYAPVGRLPGLLIDGAPAPAGDQDIDGFVRGRAAALLARKVSLTVAGEDVTAAALGLPREEGASPPRMPLEALGVRVDVEGAIARARRLLSDGDVLERADLATRARRGEIDVPLDVSIDEAALLPVVMRVKEAADAAPVSARLDLDKKAVVPEKMGRAVSFDGAMAALRRAALSPAAGGVELPAVAYPPHVSSAFAEKLDVSATLGAYETYFSRTGDQARRGKNIDVAAQKIDGLVLPPGELVSFNDVVGERSEDNGFAKSWEIYKGEMVEGVGGGTCQVASTFYAALFFGGLDLVERLPHSRPSAYIPMGLDATVVYPIVDLKVRNPYPFPVVVHAKTQGNKLRMEVLGQDKLARVSFERELTDTFPYKRKVVFEPKLRWSKKIVLKQHGIRGFKIKRTRTIALRDGTRRKETNTDTYPPTTEVYEVPPDFDISLLPPLPEEDDDGKDGGDAAAAPSTPGAASTVPGAAATAPASPSSSAAPLGSATPVAACTENCGGPALDVVEGPGAHAPTQAQKNPPKTLMLVR